METRGGDMEQATWRKGLRRRCTKRNLIQVPQQETDHPTGRKIESTAAGAVESWKEHVWAGLETR